ncbi:MAG: hypothetical protein HY941_02360 [Gammaproteobacteria bacterium]|nr:hypothetical protein [Gammaproteobacteria bacterium]
MNKPDIRRALPQRRYTFGEFTVVVLGDIETDDAVNYRYILAVVREGDAEPGIYLTCESVRGGQQQLRLVMRDGAEVIAADPQYADIEVFTAAGLDMLRQILNLGDEEAYRLM